MKRFRQFARFYLATVAIHGLACNVWGQSVESARLRVVVLAAPEASIYLDGDPPVSLGKAKAFHTSPVPVNRTVKYKIGAVWSESGYELRSSRTVQVRGGQTVTVDLRTPEPLLKVEVPAAVRLERGTTQTIPIQVRRFGFQGPATVKLTALPSGLSIPDATITADQSEVLLKVTIDAETNAGLKRIRLLTTSGSQQAEISLDAFVAPPPCMAEAYLAAGAFDAGEAALLAHLKRSPKDDEARFGLGMLQLIRGVERVGQAIYRRGVEPPYVDFLYHLPIPANPRPQAVDYAASRKILMAFNDDLAKAEATLSEITDEKVKLPLRLEAVGWT